MGTVKSVIQRLRFPLEVMLVCVRWYVAYPLSLRNLEEMMHERGVAGRSLHDSPLLKDVALLVADGAAGIWSAFGKVFPRAQQQRCWLHKIRNVLDKVPERIESEIQERLRAIMHADTRVLAESLIENLARRLERDYSKAATCVRDDTGRMLAYYAFPEEHWRHLRTTNIIESNFDPVRARTNVCKRLRSGTSATYLVYALLVRRSSRWPLQRLRTA